MEHYCTIDANVMGRKHFPHMNENSKTPENGKKVILTHFKIQHVNGIQFDEIQSNRIDYRNRKEKNTANTWSIWISNQFRYCNIECGLLFTYFSVGPTKQIHEIYAIESEISFSCDSINFVVVIVRSFINSNNCIYIEINASVCAFFHRRLIWFVWMSVCDIFLRH